MKLILTCVLFALCCMGSGYEITVINATTPSLMVRVLVNSTINVSELEQNMTISMSSWFGEEDGYNGPTPEEVGKSEPRMDGQYAITENDVILTEIGHNGHGHIMSCMDSLGMRHEMPELPGEYLDSQHGHLYTS